MVQAPSSDGDSVNSNAPGGQQDVPADAVISESEARYRTLFEHAHDAIVMIDVEAGRFSEANLRACELFGLGHDDVLRCGVADVSPELQPDGRPSAEAAAAYIARAVDGQTPEFEWLHRSASGELITCEVRLVRLPSSGGPLVRGSMTDIRERKRTEAELARREQEFRSLAENSPDLIVRVDRELRRTYANPAVVAATGLPLSALLGKRPLEAHPESPTLRLWRDTLAEVIATGQPQEQERKVDLHGLTYVKTSIIPEFGPTGEVTGALSITRDVSSVVRAREAEARLAAVVESASDAIISVDLEGRINSWNAGAERHFGWTRAEAIGQTTEFLFGGPEATSERLNIRQRLLSGTPIPGYIREWARKDGTRFTAHTDFFPIKEPGGRLVGTAAVTRDITEERRAELALRDSEDQLRRVVDSVSAGVWVFDGERIVLVNAAAERITGYSRQELSDLSSLARMLGVEGMNALLARGRSRLAGHEHPRQYELEITTKSGEPRQVELTVNRIALHGSEAIIVSVFDVTERHHSEQELARSEARFRSIVDNSPDYITRIDRDYRHDLVNRTAEREAGLDPGRVLGKRADEMGFDPQLAQLFLSRQHEVMETGEPVEYEYAINSLGAPDHVSYRRARVVPEFGEDGRVDHVLSIVTDITAQRVAEEEKRRLDAQMQQAQKWESLGVLAGGVAHDFNNLLVAILGNAGLALLQLHPDSPARETIHDIEVTAQRAAELTRQMLAYSGKGKFVIERLNLSHVVEEMAHLLEVSVAKRATLRFAFPDEAPAIEADATQVRQVIMNLIINAADAIDDRSGVISVSTGVQFAGATDLSGPFTEAGLPAGDYAFVEVTDTGVGMDEETQARIFDPFFTTKFTGRGLGLAAVLGIVRAHHGVIKLKSTPGRGTTFRVLFPAIPAPKAEVHPAPAIPDTKLAGGRTILIADDDATVRLVTKRILEHAGFTTLEAEDGQQCIDTYLASPGVSLVLLDMTMPRMDGAQAFAELRKRDPQARVILTSGYTEQDATEALSGEGLSGFLQKPYRPQELLAAIYGVIGEAG